MTTEYKLCISGIEHRAITGLMVSSEPLVYGSDEAVDIVYGNMVVTDNAELWQTYTDDAYID